MKHLQGISCADNYFRLKTEEETDRQDKTQAGQLNAPAHTVSGSNIELSLVNMEKEKKIHFTFPRVNWYLIEMRRYQSNEHQHA